MEVTIFVLDENSMRMEELTQDIFAYQVTIFRPGFGTEMPLLALVDDLWQKLGGGVHTYWPSWTSQLSKALGCGASVPSSLSIPSGDDAGGIILGTRASYLQGAIRSILSPIFFNIYMKLLGREESPGDLE